MATDRVSIIIPCYRQGKYLSEAIDSALAQTYWNVEVIVVNDGSDDNTDEVARQYQTRINYIRKANGGVSSARNAGIKAATGAYIKFLDADDYIVPAQVEWQMTAMEERQDRVSVTSLRAYIEGFPHQYTDYVHSLRALLPDLFNQPDSSPHAWLFPSRLVRAINGWRNIKITQDWDFLCRVGKLRPQLICDERIGGYYRVHPGSLSSDKSLMAVEVAEQLIVLHDEIRDGSNRDWFGTELLGAEQRTYRRLLLANIQKRSLREELLRRIRELRSQVPRPLGSPRFELLSRVTGYRLAEQIYTRYLKLKRWLGTPSGSPHDLVGRVARS